MLSRAKLPFAIRKEPPAFRLRAVTHPGAQAEHKEPKRLRESEAEGCGPA